MKRPEIKYHYRGGIETGANYTWRDGYSQGEGAEVYYPWRTRRACRQDAIRQGGKAVFYRNGERE